MKVKVLSIHDDLEMLPLIRGRGQAQAEEDEVRYFCKMNTSIRDRRPDITREYERKTGKRIAEQFPEDGLFVMHRVPFPKGIVHVENIGGDIDRVLNRRCKIGAFPWRFEGGEASICRVVAFLDG
ncbi:MAG: hypothetical protein ACE5JP_08570 [Candidatus Bipolaricaulia bacterium]